MGSLVVGPVVQLLHECHGTASPAKTVVEPTAMSWQLVITHFHPQGARTRRRAEGEGHG
jgi:hypothetical protein